MIINMRGTHGSGKSWAILGFLHKHKPRKLYGLLGPRLPEAYELTLEGVDRPVYVLGSYVTTCGGCDMIQPYANVMPLLDKYDARGHVVFEGLLLSGSYGSITDYMENWGKNCLVLFLNTPLDVCIERVRQRRVERGNRTAFNPHNVKKKHDAVRLIRNHMLKDKIFRVQSVASDDVSERLVKVLRKANGTPTPSKLPADKVVHRARSHSKA